jgi:hypothetical protein
MREELQEQRMRRERIWSAMMEMACISRKKANCTAEINESKAKIKGTVERNRRLIRLVISMRITGVVVVPQDVCAMNILRA